MREVTRAETPPGAIWGVYSDSGYGKTTLLLAWALVLHEVSGLDVLVWDTEDGNSTIPTKYLKEAGGPIRLILSEPKVSPIDESYQWLQKLMDPGVAGGGIDTLGSLGDRVLSNIQGQNIKASKDESTARSGFTTANGISVVAPSRADYGIGQRGWFIPWFASHSDALAAGKMLLWASHTHQAEVTHPTGQKEVRGGPKVIGAALTLEAPKVMQELFRITVEPKGDGTVTRTIQVDTSGIFLAKERYRALNPKGVTIGVPRLDGMDGDQHMELILEREKAVWRRVFEAYQKIIKGTPAQPAQQADQAQEGPGGQHSE